VFVGYLSVTLGVIALMFLRLELLRMVLAVSRAVVDRTLAIHTWVRVTILRRIQEINSLAVVYFSKGDAADVLNRAALYVLQNEQTNHLKVVYVYDRESDIPASLAEQLSMIDRLYPRLRVDFIAVHARSGHR
jgi:hypothetical protein